MRLHALMLAGLSAACAACGFEETKQPVVEEAPLLGRWCRPADTVLSVDDRELAARWFIGEQGVMVERTLDGLLFERQTWRFAADAHVEGRTLETPAVLDTADEALVRANPTDALQALVEVDDWSAALPSAGAECDVLPSAYGHGYPLEEGWYVAGVASADAAPVPGSEWYGHGGQDAAAPFAPAKSKLIEILYDDSERMIEERLDRGAADGGPHNLLRTRAFDADGILSEDRIERWSPTPKEDVLRVLSFATVSAETLSRALVDTYEETLDLRYIPRPGF